MLLIEGVLEASGGSPRMSTRVPLPTSTMPWGGSSQLTPDSLWDRQLHGKQKHEEPW